MLDEAKRACEFVGKLSLIIHLFKTSAINRAEGPEKGRATLCKTDYSKSNGLGTDPICMIVIAARN